MPDALSQSPAPGRAASSAAVRAASGRISFQLAAGLFSVLVLLVLLRSFGFLLFHSLVELASVSVALAILLLLLGTREAREDGLLLVLGSGYAAAAGLDLLHALAYAGMNVFPTPGANLATQLWIAARALQAGGLVAAPLACRKRPPAVFVMLLAAALALALAWLAFTGRFPACYREGSGLTGFKIAAEWAICGMVLASIGLLRRVKGSLSPGTFELLLAASVCTVLSELAFTVYVGVQDLANMVGHLLKVLAYILTYRALFVTAVSDPLASLFRELKRSEAALRASRDLAQQEVAERTRDLDAQAHFLKTITDNIPGMVGYWGTDLRGIFANPGYLEWFGKAPDQVVGLHLRDLLGETLYRESEPSVQKVLEGKVQRFERTLTKADGTVGHMWVQYVPDIVEGKVAGFFVVVSDITSLKRSEAERARLQTELNQMQKMDSLGRLAGGIAHDMNNVLGAIFAVTQTLRPQYAGQPELEAGLATLEKAAERGRDMVRGLVEFSRKEIASREPVQVNDLVRQEVALLDRTLLKKYELVTDLDEDAPPVMGEPGALGSALMNLCVNAVDAMPEGGTLAVRTRRVEPAGVELQVEDTGEGMTPDVLARAMEPFYTTKPRGKGTGLGLAQVYNVARAHGGIFLLESEPGRGTRATLRLPGEGRGAGARPPVERRTAMRPLDILLVDDEELIRSTIPNMLGVLGHQVTAVPGGQEALQHLAAGPAPDLVLLDLNMPDMGGLETLRRIRAAYPRLPVLLATGYLEREAEDVLAADPRVLAIHKPYSLDEFQRTAGRVLSRAGD